VCNLAIKDDQNCQAGNVYCQQITKNTEVNVRSFLLLSSSILSLTACGLCRADMKPVDDLVLQGVTGQSGIAIGLELDINVVDINGDGLVDINNGQFQQVTGCGLGNFDSSPAGTCRLALNFANRANEWLVLKDFYGSLRIDNLYLDGGYLSAADSDPATYDSSKFFDSSGNCLLGNGIDCSDLSTGVGFENLPAMVVRMPGSYSGGAFTDPTYTPGSPGTGGVSSGYDSIRMGLTIGGASIEYGATGYAQNNLGSFLGISIADNNSAYAGADVRGSAYVFGF
jgi:hypothetical protein